MDIQRFELDGKVYLSLNDYARVNELNERELNKMRRMCSSGKIKGARKIYRWWAVPEDLEVGLEIRDVPKHRGLRYIIYATEEEIKKIAAMGIEIKRPKRPKR